MGAVRFTVEGTLRSAALLSAFNDPIAKRNRSPIFIYAPLPEGHDETMVSDLNSSLETHGKE